MYNWKRYWCPIGATSQFFDDGFIYDPEAKHGAMLSPHLKEFDKLSSIRCLTLLGEPGMGKSTVIKQVLSEIGPAVAKMKERLMYCDLKVYGDEGALIADLFQSEQFIEWRNSDSQLHLFLDSVDECRLQLPHLVKILVKEFESLKDLSGRIFLRIACRSADWPQSLTECFRTLWGSEQCQSFVLAPLSKLNVEDAAKHRSLDVKAFINAINERDAQPLAAKPITLNFLIDVYKRDGSLPASKLELYEQGCLLLCAESNSDRIDAKQVGQLPAWHRFVVATRIAAVMMFCNKMSVHLADSGEFEGAICIPELVGGKEQFELSEVNVDEASIREVLNTGLFSGRGDQLVGFAHHTFAEFLAAKYLNGKRCKLRHKLGLLQNPIDSTGSIVPQLTECAAWLSGMDREFFEEILDSDPQVLIRSDFILDGSIREKLVQKLLSSIEKDLINESGWDNYSNYRRLNHPRLSQQLKPYITNTKKNWRVRRFAIAVLEACMCKGLDSFLLKIAKDSAENQHLRLRAVYALFRIGTEASISKMKTILDNLGYPDSDWYFRSTLLEGLWPKYLSVSQLFNFIIVPDTRSSGSYRHFLTEHLPNGLKETDLPCALKWASKLDESEMREYSIKQLTDQIIAKAWTFAKNPKVVKGLIHLATVRLKFHLGLIEMPENYITNKENLRVQFLMGLMRAKDFNATEFGWIFNSSKLVSNSDIPWMLEMLAKESNKLAAINLTYLIFCNFDCQQISHLDTILQQMQQSEELNKVFSPIFVPIRLDSELALRQRNNYYEDLQRQHEYQMRQNPPIRNPPPAAELEELLKETDTTGSHIWAQVIRVLQLEDTSTHYTNDFQVDITTLPGWKKASSEIRDQIIRLALRFLIEQDPQTLKWISSQGIPYVALDGYKAIYLLNKESALLLDTVDASVWSKWAGCIVLCGDYTGNAESPELSHSIACRCLKLAENAVVGYISAIIRARQETDHIFMLPSFIELCWKDSLAEILIETLTDKKTSAVAFETILSVLLKHSVAEAKRFAELYVSKTDKTSYEKRLRTCIALLNETIDAGWSSVRIAICKDTDFGKAVFERLVERGVHRSNFILKLKEEDAADLYIWLQNEFLQLPGLVKVKTDRPGRSSNISELSNIILNVIKSKGTRQSVASLRKLHATFPRQEYLSWYIAEGLKITRQETWNPLKPRELLKVLQAPRTLLVQNPAQLQSTLIESLEKLQSRLHDETPSVRDVWDRCTQRKDFFRPVSEDELSDYVKRHLEQDLKSNVIIPLREVRIRNKVRETKGQRTDIHVTAIIPSSNEKHFETIRVIVEVKCTWEAHVETALKAQLKDRYLKENSCQHGIYLVGWFHCDAWDRTDSRYKKSKKETISKARTRYRNQAKSNSTADVNIQSFVLDTALR